MKEIFSIRNLLVLVFVVFVVLGFFFQSGHFGKREKKYVFLDLGANTGDSARFFVDINDKNDHPLKAYGAKNGAKWEIYSFEANPVHDQKLDEAKKFVESLGHKHHVYKQTAAWIKDEKLTFYLDTVNTANNFWGSSLHKEHGDAQRSNYQNINVQGVDISRLLKNYKQEDEIVLKIDIEGSEFPLLDHLIREGSIHLVDIISIEFHAIFKSEIPINDLINYYKTFFKLYKIQYYPWYMGHGPFHN